MSAECTYCGKDSQEVERILQGPGVAMCNECVGRALNALVAAIPAERETSDFLDRVTCTTCSRSAKEMTRMVVLGDNRNLCSNCIFSAYDMFLAYREHEAKIVRVV